MRRFGFIAVACIVAVAFVPASALARHHHKHHTRHHHKHHSRAHVKRFGSSSSTSGSADSAGTVQSFSNGVLTIMLNDGSTASGRVTSRTELECEAPEQNNGPNESSRDGGGGREGEQGEENEQEQQGEENEQEGNQACSTANLTPGTMVKEAELRISSSGKTWEKVELISQGA